MTMTRLEMELFRMEVEKALMEGRSMEVLPTVLMGLLEYIDDVEDENERVVASLEQELDEALAIAAGEQ